VDQVRDVTSEIEPCPVSPFAGRRIWRTSVDAAELLATLVPVLHTITE
jgi:hypothetical protein